jgi:hypothetical protein
MHQKSPFSLPYLDHFITSNVCDGVMKVTLVMKVLNINT